MYRHSNLLLSMFEVLSPPPPLFSWAKKGKRAARSRRDWPAWRLNELVAMWISHRHDVTPSTFFNFMGLEDSWTPKHVRSSGGKKNGDFSMFQAVSITSTWNSRGWNNFGLLHGEWNLGTLQMGKKNWIGTTKNLSYEKYPTGYFPLNLGWLIGILSSWFIIVPR